MIKLTASLSKKIPIAGMNYSSQSFLAGLEVELSDAAALPEVQARIREVYQLLENSINEQIAEHRAQLPEESSARDNRHSTSGNSRPPYQGGRNDNRSGNRGNYQNGDARGQSFPASQAQLKAITAITREQGFTEDDLRQLLQEQFRKSSPQELTMREASRLISQLKENRPAA